MNIFILSSDPYNAAIAQCDAHVVKMTLESTQLLCNCFPPDTFPTQYKRTHYNHPCSIWARESIQNFNWLLDHAIALCSEYKHRYGKVHKCKEIIDTIQLLDYTHYFNRFTATEFALAMPVEFYAFNSDRKGTINAVESYRNYYKSKVKTMYRFHYTNRTVPSWLGE